MTRSKQVSWKRGVSSHIASTSARILWCLTLLNLLARVVCTILFFGVATQSYAIDLPDFEENETGNLPNFNEDELPEFFQRFFEGLPDTPGASPRAVPTAGFGSGFVLSEDGYVVTNAHVIRNATAITLELPDGRQFDAEIVGTDERSGAVEKPAY